MSIINNRITTVPGFESIDISGLSIKDTMSYFRRLVFNVAKHLAEAKYVDDETYEDRVGVLYDFGVEVIAYFAKLSPADVKYFDWDSRLRLCQSSVVALGKLACKCPAEVSGSTWEARLSATDPSKFVVGSYNYDFAVVYRLRLALLCPSNVDGSTWGARLNAIADLPTSDPSLPSNQATLATFCPLDVKGSTFDKRVAQIKTREDRRLFAISYADYDSADIDFRFNLLGDDNIAKLELAYTERSGASVSYQDRLDLINDVAEKLGPECDGIVKYAYDRVKQTFGDTQ